MYSSEYEVRSKEEPEEESEEEPEEEVPECEGCRDIYGVSQCMHRINPDEDTFIDWDDTRRMYCRDSWPSCGGCSRGNRQQGDGSKHARMCTSCAH